MGKIIGLKQLREGVERYAKEVGKGESFIVMRRSKPLFMLTPVDSDGWETVIDFTKMKKGGVDVRDLLKRL
jgi:hypothetical protein